jgi:hypothetical protein
MLRLDSNGSWRWRVTLGITSFWTLSIVQYSKKLENTTFWRLDLSPSSGKGGKENLFSWVP